MTILNDENLDSFDFKGIANELCSLISRFIYEKRRLKKISREKLATITGVDRKSIYNIEFNKSSYTFKNCITLVYALGYKMIDVMNYINEKRVKAYA